VDTYRSVERDVNEMNDITKKHAPSTEALSKSTNKPIHTQSIGCTSLLSLLKPQQKRPDPERQPMMENA
jgi:hypothetical protein